MNCKVVLIPYEKTETIREIENPGEVIQTNIKVEPGITVTRIFHYEETRQGEDGSPLLVYKERMGYYF